MMVFLQNFIGTQIGLLSAFIVVAAVVVLTGIKLSVYGDALGDRTGLSGGLIGLIFLAGVTSLPELVVSVTSVTQASCLADGADLAVGNMLGSNIFNLLILGLLVLFFPKKFDTNKLETPHTDSSIYGLIMLALFSLCFWIDSSNGWNIPFLNCSFATLFLPVVYGFILVREHKQEQESEDDEVHLPEEDRLAQQAALPFYSVLIALCVLIIAGGIALSLLGSRMALPAEQGGFGLQASLIGTLFLAISTSLPELVLSFASVRLGFLDMAVGNVLGSNMFNLLIIFVADIAMRGNNMLQYASKKNWGSVATILGLTLLAIGLLHSKKKKVCTMIAVVMLLLYLIVFMA